VVGATVISAFREGAQTAWLQYALKQQPRGEPVEVR
jgi:hypothetical protein